MVDLAPPVAPKEEEKKGFFSKLLRKVKENPLSPNAKLSAPSEPTEEYEVPEDAQPLDLEAIRSKLGVEEESTSVGVEERQEQAPSDPIPSEESSRVRERNDEGVDGSPWTMDAPDDWLLTNKPETSVLEREPLREVEPLKEPPIEVIEQMGKPEIVIVEEHNREEPQIGARVVEPPQVKEPVKQVEEKPTTPFTMPPSPPPSTPINPPPRMIPPLSNVQNLVTEHFGLIEEGVKALQAEVGKAVLDPRSSTTVQVFSKETSPDKHFILKTGERVASLRELMNKLDSMSDEVFRAHVTENKNDFANWIRDVLDQEKLAEEIRTKKAKEELLALLQDQEAEVHNQLSKEKANLELEHFELEKKTVELERARDRFETLKLELENKGKEWETFKQQLIQDTQAHLAEGVRQALVEEQQKLEQERIRLAGQQNKLDVRLKSLEQDRKQLEDEKKTWEVERRVLESLKEREKVATEKSVLLDEREQMLKEKEEEVKAIRATLKEALGGFAGSGKSEEKPTHVRKKGDEKVEVEEEDSELEVPGEDELRSLEEQIAKKIKTSKGKEESVTFDLENLDIRKLESRKNSSSSKEEIEKQIAHCKKLILQGGLENAKEEYNLIKDLFAHASLEPEDKPLIYNSIRELYNDIHLALLA